MFLKQFVARLDGTQVRFIRVINFTPRIGFAYRLPGQGTVLRGETFNLLNDDNVYGRNGTYGNVASGIPSSTFGTPQPGINYVDPSRQFQFQLGLRF